MSASKSPTASRRRHDPSEGVDALPDLSTVDELADFLRVTPSVLSHWRARRIGPAWFSMGPRGLVRYAKRDVLDWLARNRREGER